MNSTNIQELPFTVPSFPSLASKFAASDYEGQEI
jgi:hypothetical protein